MHFRVKHFKKQPQSHFETYPKKKLHQKPRLVWYQPKQV